MIKEIIPQLSLKMPASQMRYIYITLAVFFFTVGLSSAEPNPRFPGVDIQESNSQQVTAEVNLPSGFLSTDISAPDNITYQLCSFEGENLFLENPGEPRLPVEYIWLQVPVDAADFQLDILESESKQKDNLNIYPAPRRYFREDPYGNFREVEEFTKDEEFYSQDIWYPGYAVSLYESAFFRDLKMVRLAIYPLQFNPLQQKITHYTRLKIRLSYSSNQAMNQVLIDTDSSYHRIFSNLLPNYNYSYSNSSQPQRDFDNPALLTYEDLDNPPAGLYVDYLVIVPPAFYNSNNLSISSSLYRLCDYRAAATFQVAVVSTEDIYRFYPPEPTHEYPEAESIQKFIKYVYDSWRGNSQIPELDYVLLVGDADFDKAQQNWFLPTWFSNGTNNSPTSDNPYACVSGEDDVPDLMLGRLPVKDENELNNMVSKTIDFETTIPQGENNWSTRNLFLAGNRDTISIIPDNEARDTLLNQRQEVGEWNCNYPGYEYNSDTVINYLNNEGCLIVTYNGHGSIGGWASPTIDILDLAGLDNAGQAPAVIFSLACLTGSFDWLAECFGEELVQRAGIGAVSFFGACGNAHVMSWDYDPIVLNAIYQEGNYIVGSVIQELKASNIPEDRSIYNLLGDPALNLSRHIQQSTLPEFHPSISLKNLPQSVGDEITLNITVENFGLSDARDVAVHLYEEIDGEIMHLETYSHISIPAGEGVLIQEPWIYEGGVGAHFVLMVGAPINQLCEYNDHLLQDFYFSLLPIYVDDSNHGYEDGSFAHPFNTIQEAVHLSLTRRMNTEEIRIYVMEGTYDTAYTVSVPRYTYIKGVGKTEKIIVKDRFHTQRSSSTLENLTVDLQDEAWEPNWLHYGNIIGNIFRNCIIAAETLEANFKNNIFYDNSTLLRHLGFLVKPKIYFTNNNMINNTVLFDLSYVPGDDAILYLKNNIIRQNGTSILSPFATINADYNNSDDQTVLNAGQNNINLDPLFVNEATHDYLLGVGSPCINAGDPYGSYNDPDHSRNDMGAYGGPQANMPSDSLTITSPAEMELLETLTPAITWDSSGGMTPEEKLVLVISHPGKAQRQYSNLVPRYQRFLSFLSDLFSPRCAYANPLELVPYLVDDLNVVVVNSGSFQVPEGILSLGVQYTLKLFKQSDPKIKDTVHFSIISN